MNGRSLHTNYDTATVDLLTYPSSVFFLGDFKKCSDSILLLAQSATFPAELPQIVLGVHRVSSVLLPGPFGNPQKYKLSICTRLLREAPAPKKIDQNFRGVRQIE